MPEDFTERLRDLIHALRVQDKEFASAGGVTKTTFSGYLAGKAEPNRKTLTNWVKEFGINGHWLLTGEGEMLQKNVPAQAPAAPTGDPIAQRLETVERILRKSGASDAEIRAAVMAALQAGEAKASEKDAERKVGNSEG